ncbi:cyclopropane-fatty-acyl-phospholipid synthase family protein, partial [Streptomyces sp. 2MCAF27]
MNREKISRLAHADHPIASPIDDDAVRRLLEVGLPRGDERVLDLGCGGGEWLLRALSAQPKVHAEGVDISEPALADARAAAERLGAADRLVLHQQGADGFSAPHSFD